MVGNLYRTDLTYSILYSPDLPINFLVRAVIIGDYS